MKPQRGIASNSIGAHTERGARGRTGAAGGAALPARAAAAEPPLVPAAPGRALGAGARPPSAPAVSALGRPAPSAAPGTLPPTASDPQPRAPALLPCGDQGQPGRGQGHRRAPGRRPRARCPGSGPCEGRGRARRLRPGRPPAMWRRPCGGRGATGHGAPAGRARAAHSLVSLVSPGSGRESWMNSASAQPAQRCP